MPEIINGIPSAATIQSYMDTDVLATALNTVHRDLDEVATALNTTHRSSDGKNHADVVTNTAGISANVTAIGLNTTHRGSDGSNHSKVGANETAIALNTTHRSSNGSNHSQVVANKQASISFVIDGGGEAITTGIKGDLEVPFACTITEATLLADQSGAIVIDIWKQAYADFPPEDANSITASAPPTIAASGVKAQDSTLSGWTTSLAKGDTLRFNVDSVTTIQRITLSLKVDKT